MNAKTQLGCLYCCYGFMVLFGVGFALAGFIPPPPPSASATEIAARFSDNATGIRAGIVLCMLGSALLLPWGCAVATQMRRIEGSASPLAYTWVAATALVAIEFIYPSTWWGVAAFRPGENPELVQRFNDLGWLPFLGITSTAILQAVILGLLTLRDSGDKQVFPRWFGYANLAAALLFAPASLVFFFKTGPLAWNGVISWWVLITAGFGWFVLVTVVTARAVKQQAAEPPPVDQSAELGARVAELEIRLEKLSTRSTGLVRD